jgi:Protein of unknown function (DUF559)
MLNDCFGATFVYGSLEDSNSAGNDLSYIVDFVCLEKRLVVEVDGGQHAQQRSYDDTRDGWLKAEGFIVLRFWDHEVLTRVGDVKEAIYKVLIEPPPWSSPATGAEKGKQRERNEKPKKRLVG